MDWNMPGLAALELIEGVRRARSPQAMRLIILSALSGEQDVVTALDLGADDYIAKPFSLREVVARVSAVLRTHPLEHQRPALNCDELVLDAATNRVTARGRPLNLRGVEYRLLEFLMSHAGRSFNRTQLLAQVWGDDCDVDERTVDVNVQRLRKILSEPGYEAYIQTVRGFGYRFASPAQNVT
jgi:two-component system phosphate regulon response regulator PhoB